jgi:protease-4
MTEKKLSFWKIFWPTFTAVIIVSAIYALIFFGIIGAIIAGVANEESNENSSKTILHMTLEGVITENSSSKFNPSTFSIEKKIGLSDILFGLEKAKSDPNIKGLYIEFNGINCGISSAKEIRRAIGQFQKSGKFVVAYTSGEMISQKQLYVTSIVKENYGFPGTMVEFLGLGTEPMFFKNTLDLLGLEMQVIRGRSNDFKSAVEPFLYTKMSDSSRLQTSQLLQNIWKELRCDIAKDIKTDTATLSKIANQALVTSVEQAVKFHFFKASKYKDEILSILTKKVNIESSDDLELLAFEKYARKNFYNQQISNNLSKPNIAIILAEGGISVDGDELTSNNVAKYIQEARLDKNIKTIVLRVNSPGGSALASDIIWREVVLANKVKKVIVSMGDVAASGGYYISTAASTIFAEPTTITGSIGVFGIIPYTGKFFQDKLGITFDNIKTNNHASLSLNHKLSPEELRIIQKQVDKIYTDFLTKVSEGRKISISRVHQYARGRVWTGSDAKKIGLVDELGGLNDAIAYAAKKAKIEKIIPRYWPEKKLEPMEEILSQLEDLKETSASFNEKNNTTKIPANIQKYYAELLKLETMQGIQMRMPFTLEIH